MDIPIWLPLAFFLVALVYSLMGFGGGSSYLAFLVLAGLPYQSVPPLALICNLIVAGSSLWHFYRGGYLKFKRVLPFIIFSIPSAYWGGKLLIAKELFSLLLGFSLLVVALRMFLPDRLFERSREVSSHRAWIMGLPIGGILGFLSGLAGIGGGIFLSPLLLLMRWVNVKEAAAAASLFIVVNSFAGLLGQFHKGAIDFQFLFPLGLAVFLGGQIGSRLGAYRLPQFGLQRLLAGLILYVSVKLILGV